MSDLSWYLRRFRRLVAPPGRPGPAGATTDAHADQRAELAELFVLIDDIERQAQGILEDADEQARRRSRDADEEAQRIVADADAGLDQARADAAARHRRHIEGEIVDIRAEAAAEAEDLRGRAQHNLDALTERIVRRILHGQGTGG
jgi:vacuolar-type H+-ATPase subunit H